MGFSNIANAALNSAVGCAEDMGHTYIGSEHLLVALLREECIAREVLQENGLMAEKLDECLIDLKNNGWTSPAGTMSRWPRTPTISSPSPISAQPS